LKRFGDRGLAILPVFSTVHNLLTGQARAFTAFAARA
jgi:hypothetical protein